ncbi:MAG: hypothetical protein FJ387_28965 [Verrucomicrobia bacterium]|nr:hypothetical protein [Verrucomicrobiota bacterium]
MDKTRAYRLVEEVRLQCRFAQLAYQNLRAAVNTPDTERVFVHAHSVAQHAVNVARLLWPERAASAARGEFLRSELKATDTTPLRGRELLAQAKPSDEQYEDWVATLDNANYVDLNIMPQTALGPGKQDTFQRSLDPDLLQFQFRGETCDLAKLVEEIRRLEGTCQQWLRGHTPW